MGHTLIEQRYKTLQRLAIAFGAFLFLLLLGWAGGFSFALAVCIICAAAWGIYATCLGLYEFSEAKRYYIKLAKGERTSYSSYSSFAAIEKKWPKSYRFLKWLETADFSVKLKKEKTDG